MKPEPDFLIKNLADYSVEDLEDLLSAVLVSQFEYRKYQSTLPAFTKRIDIWCYRIKDALSQARKRESENLND